jgi:hypothetical protein
VFLVGSGVDIAAIKPTLEAATSLSVTAPEEPEMALARGAALASANAQLGAPSTVAMPYLGPGGLAESGSGELAYSAVADDETGVHRASRATSGKRRSPKPMVAIITAMAIFVGGAVALALALALDIGPHVEQRPDISKNVVAPAPQAPAKPAVPAPPPPSAVPAPETAAPSQVPAPNSPQQDPPTQTRDHDHDWLHRHLERGILGP